MVYLPLGKVAKGACVARRGTKLDRRVRLWQAAALITAIAALAVGCGDDDDDDAGGAASSDRLTKEEYIAAGDRLCEGFLDMSMSQPEPETPQDLIDLLGRLITEAEALDAEFTVLAPPDDAADVHRTLLDSLERSTAKVKEARDALERQDPAWETLFEEADQIGQASDDAAKAYGFKVCGSEQELAEERQAQ